MANKNNKGFSLIEIVIAMAVLTLLLTPIIKQFAQTMKVSRQAKEQQYINEDATLFLEEAQVSSAEELELSYSNLVAENPTYTFSTSTDARAVKLYSSDGWMYNFTDADGNFYRDAAGNTMLKVPYNVETYSIGSVEIGPENALYDKVITIDNLATQIRGARMVGSTDIGFKIKYNMSKSDIPTGFTLTNEGSAVELDSNGNVIGIIVEETEYVGNPNDTNLGNMQNLDYETVAMINGTATNFDEQAEKALFSMAMDTLKEINYEEWELGMLHSAGDNILLQHGYAPTMSKMTKIYVDEFTDADNKTYYLIKADVFYHCEYTLDGEFVEEDLTYNVFSQKFYTEKCPDVYFEYQPFIVEMVDYGGTYDVNYAANDYIMVDNYVKDAKLYIYKPNKDAIDTASNNASSKYDLGYYTYTTKAPDADDLASETAYKQFLMDNAVAIHIAKANENVEDMKIFTNLDVKDNGSKSQFFVSSAVYGAFDDIKSDNPTYSSLTLKDYDRNLIKTLSDDTRYNDRLRTVTVTLIPMELDDSGNKVKRDDANTVILTGPKGEK